MFGRIVSCFRSRKSRRLLPSLSMSRSRRTATVVTSQPLASMHSLHQVVARVLAGAGEQPAGEGEAADLKRESGDWRQESQNPCSRSLVFGLRAPDRSPAADQRDDLDRVAVVQAAGRVFGPRHHVAVHLDRELRGVLAELPEQVGDGERVGERSRFGVDGDGRHRWRLRNAFRSTYRNASGERRGCLPSTRPACYNYDNVIRDTSAGDRSMSSAVEPTADFFDGIRASGLLTPAQIDELSGWIGANRPDVQAFARELNRRGWLTAFQIKEIFRGRRPGTHARALCPARSSRRRRMGRVFKVHDTRLGRDAALKIIRKEKLKHPAAETRFKHEIEALAKMKHPNVVEVFNADQVGDTHYYEMEFVDGTDLTKLVRDRGPAAGSRGMRVHPPGGARACTMPSRRGWCIATSSRATCWSRATDGS